MRRFTRRRLLLAGVAGSVGLAGGARAFPDARPARAKPDPIRIGQLGVAHAHADGKMRSYRESPEFEVVGVVEPNADRRAAAEKSEVYRGLRWMTRDQLLETPGLQAVAVETEVRDLLENAQVAVDAGLSIHLDKPAGSSLSAFRRVLATAEAKERVVQMGYMYRYNPAIVLLREFLARGWLGEIFELHAVMSKVVGRASRQALSEYPGGILFELGCHIIDLAVGVLGKPGRVTAYPRRSSPIDDALVDNMLAVLEYPRATATVKSSAQEVEGFSRRHFVVCGTEGTFHIQPLDSPRARVALSRSRSIEDGRSFRAGYQDVTFSKYVRYVDDARDFAQIIRGEKASDFPPAHDLAVQETVLRASALPLEP